MLFRVMLVFAMSAFAVLTSSAADAAKKVPVKSARILVAYYSWSESGNTRYMAEQVQDHFQMLIQLFHSFRDLQMQESNTTRNL